MNWQAYWDEQARKFADPHKQVARSSGRVPVDEALLGRIADHIARHLDLQPADCLLDVCCGNGMLTRLLASKCREVVGVDISSELIQTASTGSSRDNLSFLQGDATRLREVVSGPFDKINLYFSFQYLDSYPKGRQAIAEMLALLTPRGKIFIGDIPDSDRLAIFYPNWHQRLRYYLNLRLGRSMMGKFWCEKEIAQIVQNLGAELVRVTQPQDFPYAHYRGDYVIE